MFRPVTITAVLNGWVVAVGCQTLAYQDTNVLLHELGQYLRDPDGMEAHMLKSAVNAAHVEGAQRHLGQGRPSPRVAYDGPTQSVPCAVPTMPSRSHETDARDATPVVDARQYQTASTEGQPSGPIRHRDR